MRVSYHDISCYDTCEVVLGSRVGRRAGIGKDGAGIDFVVGANLHLQGSKAGFHDAGVFAGEEDLDAGGFEAEFGHFGFHGFVKAGNCDHVWHKFSSFRMLGR